MIIQLALRLAESRLVGVLASFLFLSNFVTANLFLSGFVDSGCCFFFALLILYVHDKRFLLLLIVVFFGSLSKEVFLPVCAAYLGTYWLTTLWKEKTIDFKLLSYVTISVITSTLTVIAIQSFAAGHLVLPIDHAHNMRASVVNFYPNFRPPLFYDSTDTILRLGLMLGAIFALGFFSFGSLDQSLAFPLLSVMGVNLFFVIWISIDGGGISRTFFIFFGPIFCVLAAKTLNRLLKSEGK